MFTQEISEIKHMSKGHFFDEGTMRFFNSRVETRALSKDNKTFYFVTSERYESEPRAYTVRSLEFDGKVTNSDIRTADGFEFQQFNSRKAANAAIKEVLES